MLHFMIIVLLNQKGGVGKTTIARAIAFALALMGYKVKLVDADPQQSILQWRSSRPGLLPVGLTISAMVGTSLHMDIPAERDDYDFIIIDTPGKIDDNPVLARSAASISDFCIVPCTNSGLTIRGTRRMLEILKEVRVFKPELKVGVLINFFEKNSMRVKAKDLLEDLICDGAELLNSHLSKRVEYDKADILGLSVHETNPNGIESQEICNLLKEMGAIHEKDEQNSKNGN